MTQPTEKLIRVAAAIITNNDGAVLLVRKCGTEAFMQPGGKFEAGETPDQTVRREVKEELGVDVIDTNFLGTFSVPAANEPDHMLEASLFSATIAGDPTPTAEIAEMRWHTADNHSPNITLAPLTQRMFSESLHLQCER